VGLGFAALAPKALRLKAEPSKGQQTQIGVESATTCGGRLLV